MCSTSRDRKWVLMSKSVSTSPLSAVKRMASTVRPPADRRS